MIVNSKGELDHNKGHILAFLFIQYTELLLITLLRKTAVYLQSNSSSSRQITDTFYIIFLRCFFLSVSISSQFVTCVVVALDVNKFCFNAGNFHDTLVYG